MNRKTGFIATSLLYSFFLVFVTLFIGVITVYLQNRVYLNKFEDSSKKGMYFKEMERQKNFCCTYNKASKKEKFFGCTFDDSVSSDPSQHDKNIIIIASTRVSVPESDILNIYYSNSDKKFGLGNSNCSRLGTGVYYIEIK